MNPQLLIDAVIRQTMVLIAQLATSGGARTPLAHLAHQVFVDLTSELEAQGLSRKVTADMFGISLRSYQRKLNRLSESHTESGQSLWEAVFGYLSGAPVRQREDVLRRFSRDDAVSVRGILRDLVESGLVFVTGNAEDAVYRVVRAEDVSQENVAASDTLLWAMIYREGPLGFDALVEKIRGEAVAIDASLQRLNAAGHIQRRAVDGEDMVSARQFLSDGQAGQGWEAAVYDHFHAVVRTLCARLDPDTAREGHRDHIGGSTYSLDIYRDHPLRERALGTLARMRAELSELRSEVNRHNASHSASENSGRPEPERIVLYVGQCVMPFEGVEATGA